MNYTECDEKFIWHPFTHQLNKKSAINIVKGEGVYLIDDKGNKYIDAVSSWWVNLHGHCHPYISKKISEQLYQLEHSIFSDFTHPKAIELAAALLSILPSNQHKLFYSDDGSTAVEVALKMALQYWNNRSENKHIFIAFENAYHGDTFGSMSVGDRNVFNKAFESLLFEVIHVPLPTSENMSDLKAQFNALFQQKNIAGFIFEPLVQGAAGMLMYEAKYLNELLLLCQQNGVITIADEVMTGFGRTGKNFACDYLNTAPDIICLSKGLTGGYMPLGITTCSEHIYKAFLQNDKTKTFFHGHSYTANPLACTAALANFDVLCASETQKNIQLICDAHNNFLEKIKHHAALKSVRQTGTILAFEIASNDKLNYLNEGLNNLQDFFIARGIILRPLGNIFYLITPYCVTLNQLHYIYSTIEIYLNELLN
ncbi:MAG: adenosylmethionine--8-amino-7-oxononanoate transaminase [Bacteroidetes bacterium]|nr:adenosylmethionine--8-amino-7-oxononanoate transaminase [Bacteroidota bacterium]